MNSVRIPYLSSQDLDQLEITTHDVITSIEDVIKARTASTAYWAPKSVLLPPDGRYLMSTTAASDAPPILAVKSLVMNPANSDQGLAQINGVVTVLNADSGLPIAILDGNWVTAIRTAGLSATAAKYMAVAAPRRAAFIGSGVQAQSHLKAFAELYKLQDVRVFGRGGKSLDTFLQLAETLNVPASACSTARDAVENADIILSAISHAKGPDPFLSASDTKPGAFTTITDLCATWRPESFSSFDRIAVDDLEQEAAFEDSPITPNHNAGDLSALVLGNISGRGKDTDRTAFYFRGHAIGDLALTRLALSKAGL